MVEQMKINSHTHTTYTLYTYQTEVTFRSGIFPTPHDDLRHDSLAI